MKEESAGGGRSERESLRELSGPGDARATRIKRDLNADSLLGALRSPFGPAEPARGGLAQSRAADGRQGAPLTWLGLWLNDLMRPAESGRPGLIFANWPKRLNGNVAGAGAEEELPRDL